TWHTVGPGEHLLHLARAPGGADGLVVVLQLPRSLRRPDLQISPAHLVRRSAAEKAFELVAHIEVTALVVLDEGDARTVVHEGLEAALAVAQGLLHALALRDVAGNDRAKLLAAGLGIGDRGLDGKLLAVGALALEVGTLPTTATLGHGPGERPRLARGCLHEIHDRLAQRLGGPATEHLLRRRIEQSDPVLGIRGKDGVD